MSRQSLLPCAWLSVALGLAVAAAPVPAWSQDRSTQERLDRLERDLNMLQRQVYRGAPPPPMVGGDSGAAVNAEIRMGRLEEQMRDLTGRVEEFVNQIEQLHQRVEQIASDIEERFNQAGAAPLANAPAARSGAAASARTARSRAAEPPDAADQDLPPPRRAAGAIPPGTAVAPPGAALGGGPAPVFGTLTPPGAVPAAPEFAASAPAGVLSGGSAAEQYNHAFGLLKQANYPAAEAELKAFVEQHPGDPMAGNAQYWLGETYYTRNRFLEAASAFAEGYKRYPKSAKAADDLLKLAMSLGRANQKQNACLALAQLDHDFPKPGAAVKEHAAAEKKHLGC